MRKNHDSWGTCRIGHQGSQALPYPSWCSSSTTLYHCTCQLMSLSRRTANNESDLCVVQPSKTSVPETYIWSILLLPVLSLKIFNISTDAVLSLYSIIDINIITVLTRTFKKTNIKSIYFYRHPLHGTLLKVQNASNILAHVRFSTYSSTAQKPTIFNLYRRNIARLPSDTPLYKDQWRF